MKQYLKGLIYALIAIGMIVNIFMSMYIMIQKTSNDSLHQEFPDKCFTDVPGGGGCFTVQTSAYAITFGIPNPYYGVFFFTILFVLFAIFAAVSNSKELTKKVNGQFKWLIPTMTIIMVAGSIFSIWLLFIQFVILQTTCIYCLWVDGIMIAATIIFLYMHWADVQKYLIQPIRSLFEDDDDE